MDTQQEIKVEKNIKMPGGGRGGAIYPWRTMNVGESFLFPNGYKQNSAHGAARLATHAHAPKKFSARTTPDGMRCWRVA